MTNSVSSTNASHALESTQPTPPKTQIKSQAQRTSPLREDTVTLKSTGDADHDGDSK